MISYKTEFTQTGPLRDKAEEQIRCIFDKMRSGFHPCAYADASPGVGSLVGREFAQSLGARLLVSVFARDGSHS